MSLAAFHFFTHWSTARGIERAVVCRSHQYGVAKSITVLRAGAALDCGLQRLEIVAYHGFMQRIRDR